MRAIILTAAGGPEVMELADVPEPTLMPGTARVDIHATALNRADLAQRRGHYPPPPGESNILGLEMAGIVSAVAPDVVSVKVGDRVMALLPGGGYAETAIVPAGMLMPVPLHLSFAEAAAIPEVFLTSYSNLVWLGGMTAGYRVLIHAGASGVGTAAIQLVQALGGRAIITAGSAAKRSVCVQLGAELALDYKAGPFAEEVLAWSEGKGVNILFDFVCATYMEQNLRCLADDGRLVIIGTMGGSVAQQVDLSLLLRRRLQILGTALRSRPLAQKIALTREFSSFAMPLFVDGSLRPIVDRTFSLADAAAAHRYMESNLNTGKIVLKVRS